MPDEEKSTCTCGQCIDGWLSPRMRERLEGEGDFLHYASKGLEEGLHEDPDILQGGILSELIIGADVTLHYIPMELHEKMTAGFYSGYIFVLLTVVRLFLRDGASLDDDDDDDNDNEDDADADEDGESKFETKQAEGDEEPEKEAEGEDDRPRYPTVDIVNQTLASIQKAAQDPSANEDLQTDAAIIAEYLDAGGKASYALEAIVDVSWENSPEGTKFLRTPTLQRDEAEFDKACEGLPRCANDLDFRLVRTKLGLEPERYGPHWFFLTDLEDDEDGEGEDEGEVMYTGVKADLTAGESQEDGNGKETASVDGKAS